MHINNDNRPSVAQQLAIDKAYYEVTLPRKRYKILYVTDLHLRDKEFKNTNGYVEEKERILLRLIEGAEKGIYNTVILLGDVFDTSYTDVAKALYHISLFSKLHDLLEGRLFKLIGNHSLNKKKNYVPTFFLLGTIKSTRVDKEELSTHITSNGFIQNFGLRKAVFDAPDRIFVNGNVINLFHYHRTDKTYFDSLIGVDYNKHIGCYHDTIMPSHVKETVEEAGSSGKFSMTIANNADTSGIFSNVDYAMLGDIHSKIGEFTIIDKTTNKETLVDIPGVLGPTAYHRAQLHNEVFLPLTTIEENGEVIKSHIRVPLTDYRDIFKITEIEEQRDKKSKLKEFKEALDFLQQESSLKVAVDNADIDNRTKEILTDLVEGRFPEISYRK